MANEGRNFVFKSDDAIYNELLKRAKILKVEQEIAIAVSRDFLRWKANGGAYYAVKRLKYIYNIILNYLANPQSPPKISDFEESKKHWIRKRNPYILKGVYGFFQTRLDLKNRPLEARKYLMFLKLYTTLCEDHVTLEMIQAQKAIIEYQSLKDDNQLNFYLNMLSYDNMRKGLRKVVGPCKSHQLFENDTQKPKPFVISNHKSMSTERRFWKQVFNLNSTPHGRELLESNSLLKETMLGLPTREHRINGDLVLGTINCVFDPGLKNRFVLDCSKTFENALVPFEQRLAQLIKSLPWDITYEEEKCFNPIMEHLAHNNECYAVDLSQATDRFPWEAQYFLCGNLFQDCPNMLQSIDLVDKMLKYPSVFRMPDNYKGTSVLGYWRTGQPMGLLGSFAMFTLSHGCILFALNGYQWNKDFYVHGDDVVILNQDLYIKYIHFLEDCDIPHNPDKTIISNVFTEINSKIITSNVVLVLPKWRPLRPDNMLDMASLWGTDIVISHYKSNVNKSIVQKVLSLPPPYGVNDKKYLTESEKENLNEFNWLFEDSLDTPDERAEKTLMIPYESARQLVYRRFNDLSANETLGIDDLKGLLQCLELAQVNDEIEHEAIIRLLPLTLLQEIANWDVSYSRQSLRLNIAMIDNINQFNCNVLTFSKLARLLDPKMDLALTTFAEEIDWTDEYRGYCNLAERHLHRTTPSSDRLSAVIKEYRAHLSISLA